MTQAATAASTGRSKPLLNAVQKESLASLLVAALICGLLAYGWVYRADPRIDPEQGIGYKLGILGGIMMLLLLIYPFRKRIRILSAIGSVGFWFRFHMLLGLLGPVAILYHARFSWGALMRARLEPFEQRTITAGGGFWTSAKSVLSIGLGTRMAERQLCRDILEGHATHDGAPALSLQGRQRLVEHTRDYFDAVRRAAEFAFYDRMFRLWHLFHLPLFLILVVTAIIHIVAVHMY